MRLRSTTFATVALFLGLSLCPSKTLSVEEEHPVLLEALDDFQPVPMTPVEM